ncbi:MULTISPECIES: GAF domain-containing sensor histidine kinase [Altibacter]|uniref:sensor histidine kinase n=1 Tax=Altibacter TaxID=1535231 RepID=UPI00054FDD8F|nr:MULTISPECIES: GAF domain-containing sensor histidine kinase [Altibacter]MCW8980344.1 GAF domain-containing sensor histidine kinase [Altibacter sp.]MCW9038049.1 GAF domain-containing sensor histidine kinase [Altibacter sp.]
MITPTLPKNEQERLNAVKSYSLLDTLPEEDFDNITALVASICDVPISLVTLLDADRNFLKSHYGIPFNESPRDISFCGHAILDESNIFIVEDARKDDRFKNNPLVSEQGAIFYAGVRLINPDGFPLGTLCVFDVKPRTLDDKQRKTLLALARQVMNLFEERKKNKQLELLQKELQNKNDELKNFAGVISHDMKMPLANMILTADILKAKYSEQLDTQAQKYISYLKQSSFTLSDYISGLLAHYESDKLTSGSHETFDLNQLLEEIVDLLNIDIDCEINFPEENLELSCNRAALEQILLNLIGNSLKYNDKEKIVIDMTCTKTDDMYHFVLSDNGMGIPKDKQNEIFDLFTTVGNLDRNGKKGHGIGLSTVQKLVNGMGGNISVNSELGKRTTFEFTFK